MRARTEKTRAEYKRRPPGRLSKEVDEFVEAFLTFHFDRLSVSEWDNAEPLWIALNLADQATAKRVIAFALQLCADRQQILPSRLAKVANEFLVRPSARNRIQHQDEMVKAAAFQAEHPGASLREIGEAAGVDHTVVRTWQKQFAYQRELVQRLIPHAQRDYGRYVERFGSPFAIAGLPEPSPFALMKLRPHIVRALNGGVPIEDRSVLVSALYSPPACVEAVDQKTIRSTPSE